MIVLCPCCGSSSRYPNQPPKWMLPSHDRRPMIQLALSKIDFDLDDLRVVILREHEEKFSVREGLKRAFGRDIQTVILETPTRSQSETVAEALKALNLDDAFLVKDSDNIFKLDTPEEDFNYICTESLNHFDSINPRNKSYIQSDHQDIITNIREKEVISDTFNVGGYYFTSSQHFLEYYDRLSNARQKWEDELYLSDIIGSMILDGIPFKKKMVSEYQDWGTIHEWRQALLARKAYFVSLDGFLFERGSEHFAPHFNDTQPHQDAVDCVKSLAQQNHTIIYVTIRSRNFEATTRQQLKNVELPEGQIVWDCPIAQWVTITSPHATLPFQSGKALEVAPDAINLLEKIRDEFR